MVTTIASYGIWPRIYICMLYKSQFTVSKMVKTPVYTHTWRVQLDSPVELVESQLVEQELENDQHPNGP